MSKQELCYEFFTTIAKLHRSAPQEPLLDSLRGEALVLRYIMTVGSEVSPGELSEIMSISTARTSAILSSLQAKKLITRHSDIRDARRTLISLTEEGHAAAAELTEKMDSRMMRTIDFLGEDEARQFLGTLKKLAAHYNGK